MSRESLDGLLTFVCVAEHSTFSAAAAQMGVSPSAISQVIRTLEQRIGIALFNRTTRSVGLTEAGARYLERIRPAVRDILDATAQMGDENRPAGLLRINVSRSAFLTLIQPILPAFFAAYPEVEVEVMVDGALSDIVSRGFDAGIRFGDLVEKDMIAVRVGPLLQACVIASPAYFAAHGMPEHPRDLLNHSCIRFRPLSSGQVEKWEFEKGDERLQLSVSGPLILTEATGLVQGAIDGLGISYMINGFVDPLIHSGRLVRILEDWSPELPGYSLYFTSRNRVPAKLRAFVDFLVKASRAGMTDAAIPPEFTPAIMRS